MSESPTTGSRLVAEIAEAERAERTRLADRLHDEGLQLVLAARQELEEAREGDPTALDALGTDLALATEALRSLTSAMHEDVLERLPLADALDRIGADAARRGRFALELAVDPEAAGIHDALVRDIARELLANAARHAAAAHVRVEVSAVDDHLLIRVADDGKGIEPRARVEAARGGHLGLGRLERSVRELGGRFAVDAGTDDGRGTTASAWLPRRALAAQGSLEDELREERRWSAALLAALQDGLVVFRDGITIQVNDAFCRMTGFTRDELLGTTPDDYPFWFDEDRPEMRATIDEAHARRGLEQVVDLRHRSGRRFPALASSARIDDPAGDDIGMLVTIKDLTERRRAEAQQRVELELRTTIETTRRLTALLTAVDGGVPELLEALGRLLVDHLGWEEAVVNLRDPGEEGLWHIAWTSAPEIAAALAGPPVTDADWAPYLHPRFARRGVVFVPAGTQTLPDHMPMHTPEWEPRRVEDAWQADDLLLVPMRSDEALVGLLSMDCPRSGRRPTDTELDALVAAADHAAGALALTRRGGTHR